MKVVYVCGPFRGANSWEIECNIRRAEALALQVWQTGAACICPHANTRFYQGAAPDAVWLDGDLELLRRCDAVLTTANWGKSSGARAEVALASTLALPIFHADAGVGAIKDWLPTQFTRWLKMPSFAKRAQSMDDGADAHYGAMDADAHYGAAAYSVST